MNTEVLSILKKTGAFLEGHFELSSGLHSPDYVQCALVLQHPELAEKFGGMLAQAFKDRGVKVVIAPALGGVIICHETARALKTRAIFAERVSSGEKRGKMILRRGFRINKGEKVLIVEDVVTTGGSTREIVELVREAGGDVVGIGFLIDRSSGEVSFDVDTSFRGQGRPRILIEALLVLEMKTYNPEDCPLCRNGISVVKPGSRKN